MLSGVTGAARELARDRCMVSSPADRPTLLCVTVGLLSHSAARLVYVTAALGVTFVSPMS